MRCGETVTNTTLRLRQPVELRETEIERETDSRVSLYSLHLRHGRRPSSCLASILKSY